MALASSIAEAAKAPLAKLGDTLAKDAGRVESWLGDKVSATADRWVGTDAKTAERSAAKALPSFEQRSLYQKAVYAVVRGLTWVGNLFPKSIRDAVRPLYYRAIRLFQPIHDSPIISNLGKLSDRVFRGGQLGPEGFGTLKKMGVDTVINLAPEENLDPALAKAYGMKAISIAEPPFAEPSMAQGVEFLKAATDPANGKVYFHCYHGSDRTGAMAAIYRILKQGWSVDKALAEMPKYHFHAGYEDAKIKFVQDFMAYWKTLPKAQQAQILHNPVK